MARETVGFRVDADVRSWLRSQKNRSEVINKALRLYMQSDLIEEDESKTKGQDSQTIEDMLAVFERCQSRVGSDVNSIAFVLQDCFSRMTKIKRDRESKQQQPQRYQ